MRQNKAPDVQMTREEFKKLKKSMKDEKFHELLGDYMKEISNPANVAEYDQYLEQLKNDGELPEGMELIRPEPEFVIKSNLASKSDKKFTQSLYINICTHPAVAASSMADVGGKKQWSVPYFVGKIRYDQEENAEVVNTVDVVFNKESTDLAQKHREYHRVLCETAIDAAQAALLERKEMVNRDYIVPQGMKCKGDMPALLPVILDAAAKQRAKHARNKQPGGRIYNEIQELKEEQTKQKAKDAKNSEETPAEVDQEEDEPELIPAEPDFSKGPIAPKYSLVYSYPTTIGDFHNSADIMAPLEKQSPSELKLKIEMPKAESAEDLKVDLKANSLQLEYRAMYYLSLDFLFEIIVDKAKAKFVSSKKMLELTLPVVKRPPQPKPAPPPVFETKEQDAERELTTSVSESVADQKETTPSESEPVQDNEKTENTEEPEISTVAISNPMIQEIKPTDRSSKLEDTSHELVDAEDEVAAQQPKTLDFDIMLKPQVTFLETVHIYLLHLPGYEPIQIDLLVGEDKLLVTYSRQPFSQYLLVKAEGRSSFKSVEVEKQYIREYFGFRLIFRTSDDAQVAKECFKLLTEVETTELEQIRADLHADRLRREEIQRLAREVAIQELAPEITAAQTETQEDQDTGRAAEEAVEAAKTETRGEEALESSPTQDEKTENPEPLVEQTSKHGVKQYGWQLLDLEIIQYACELD